MREQMHLETAQKKDQRSIARLDRHIPPERLRECIQSGRVYVLRSERHGPGKDTVLGVLRYSLFWQTIPFLELLYLEEAQRNRGFGTEMMCRWEAAMRQKGYRYAMTSTQADENAWHFYEKLGYRRAGGFFPPEQEAEEWLYVKLLEE